MIVNALTRRNFLGKAHGGGRAPLNSPWIWDVNLFLFWVFWSKPELSYGFSVVFWSYNLLVASNRCFTALATKARFKGLGKHLDWHITWNPFPNTRDVVDNLTFPALFGLSPFPCNSGKWRWTGWNPLTFQPVDSRHPGGDEHSHPGKGNILWPLYPNKIPIT